MTKGDLWVENFFVGENFIAEYVGSGKYVLPARHLAWYESPLDAAASVIRDMVGLRIPKSRISLLDVQSHLRGETDSKDRPAHWDLCFVYGAEVSDAEAKKLKRLQWFKELAFKPRSGLKGADFTRGHGDILEEARLIKKTS